MLHIVLKCLNENTGLHKTGNVRETNPFVKLFDGLDSEYLIALNVGAIWNVIALWIHQGMEDDPGYVRETIRRYLKRLSGPNQG